MSWDAHVKSLMGGRDMQMAGIFGKDGNPWGVSAGFNPSQQDIKRLVDLVQAKDLKGESIRICDVKYMASSPPDDGMVTVLSLGGSDKYVCTICETTQSVIVGITLASAAGASRDHMDRYKTYLKGIGY